MRSCSCLLSALWSLVSTTVQSPGVPVSPLHPSNTPSTARLSPRLPTVRLRFIGSICAAMQQLPQNSVPRCCGCLVARSSGAAAVLVEAALRKAHARIVSTVEEEEATTFEELLSRPPGKQDWWPYGRSLLHDDITAVVIEMPLAGVTASKKCRCVASSARRTCWALSPRADQMSETQDSQLEQEDCSSSSEDDYDDSGDTRLRRHTVEAIPADQEAAILDALDDGTGGPRLRRQTVDLDWDQEP